MAGLWHQLPLAHGCGRGKRSETICGAGQGHGGRSAPHRRQLVPDADIDLNYNFGNPYLSFELPHVPTLAVTYDGEALAQRAAVKVWLGEIAPQGTLPVQLPTVKIQPLPR
ncbi:MAG: hypothetical protein R2932_35495 [Caldilineaceae bacterium]